MGSSHAPSSFRPNFLLSCLFKVNEYVLGNDLKAFLNCHDVLILKQFGFRLRHSTTVQLWRDSELLHDGMRSSWVRGEIFLDVQKAFDKISHIALLFKIIARGLPGQLIRIYQYYFKTRSFIVRVGNSYSSATCLIYILMYMVTIFL